MLSMYYKERRITLHFSTVPTKASPVVMLRRTQHRFVYLLAMATTLACANHLPKTSDFMVQACKSYSMPAYATCRTKDRRAELPYFHGGGSYCRRVPAED